MKNIFKYTSFVFAGLLILTSSCIDENFDDSSDIGISDKALLSNVLNAENESGDLSIFLELVEANGLTGILTGRQTQDQITVFAPTNGAFDLLALELGYGSTEGLLGDEDVNFVEILETHIGLANLSAAQIENGSFRSIATLSGINVPIRREDGGFVLNANKDLEILRSNGEGNGTIHIISRVMLPVRFNIDFSADFGDDFDGCSVALEAWSVVNVALEGGSGWSCTGFGFDGQGIQANGFDGGAQVVDSWIISPALESDDVILNTLKFKYASRFDGPNPEVWVISEEDYDAAFDMEAWTDLGLNFPPPASANNVFSDLSVAIPSGFHSGAFRFAFRYTSGAGSSRVTIDNIQVGEE